jgi:hypothetical protein
MSRAYNITAPQKLSGFAIESKRDQFVTLAGR